MKRIIAQFPTLGQLTPETGYTTRRVKGLDTQIVPLFKINKIKEFLR